MTKQEIEIAEAACCVATMWDQYEGTEQFDNMVGLRIQHLIKLVRNFQPSLPSDLDEAAEKYMNESLKNLGAILRINVVTAFKAGAEWMAGQGVTEEYDTDEDGMILLDSDMLGLNIAACTPSELHCKDGDLIVIQIRKK